MGISSLKSIGMLLTLLIAPCAVHAELPLTPPPSDTDNENNAPNAVSLKPDADILTFENKDKLHGNLISIEKGVLNWRYPKVTAPMLFSLPLIANLSLGSRSLKPARIDTRLILTNDDMLPGKLVSIDNNSVKIATSYAGTLTIPRPMVQQIFLESADSSVYIGPNSNTEWSDAQNKSKFNVQSGVLSLAPSGLVWQKLNLPDIAKISFKILSKSPRLAFSFYANDKFPRRPNAYRITLYSSSVDLYRYTNNSGSDEIKEFNFRDRTIPMKVDIFVSKPKKQFTILINGHVFGPYSDDYDNFAGSGSNIAFENNANSTLKIRDIAVCRWDGSSIPAKISAPSNTKSSNDTIFFANSDRASGILISATPKEIVFKTDFAELKAPPSRVSMIILAQDKRQLPRKRADDVIATLNCGGHVILALQSIKNGVLSGVSENFGEAKFNLAEFNSIQFNIYEHLLQDADNQDDD